MSVDRLNVIIFHADQWRARDTGYAREPRTQTPNLDALAREGVAFRNCFTQNPVCTPSRCAMFTGWYPHVNGHRTMHHMLRRHEPNLMRYLREAGYYVWWGGKNDLIPLGDVDLVCDERMEGRVPAAKTASCPWKPGDRLYHTFLWGRSDNYGPALNDDLVVRQAVNFLRRPPPEPFFMLVNQNLPHPPYAVEEPFYSMYDREEVEVIPPPEDWEGKPAILPLIRERMRMAELTDAEIREMAAVYRGMISRVDRNLGWLLGALRDIPLWDNTLVIVSSDHGDFAGDYGLAEKTQNTFEDCLTNIPLVVRMPGAAPQPEPSEALVELIDVFPTVAEACGLELGHTQFGRSLGPLLRGETAELRQYVHCEGGALIQEEHTHEARYSFDKAYWARVALQGEQPEVHGKAVMVRSRDWKYVRRLYDTDELYDLRSDPDELHNLIGAPGTEHVRREMVEHLATWYLETGDQVPWRWDLRSRHEEHPPWSEQAWRHGFAREGEWLEK